MQSIKQTRFCNGHAFRITDGVPQILTRLEEYNYTLSSYYRQFHNNHTKIISNYPFCWSFLPKGAPYYIYITSYNKEKVCLFIERHIRKGNTLPRVFALPNLFPKCPSETIISCIVVKTQINPKWLTLCQEVIVHSGKQVIGNFMDRYQLCVNIVNSKITNNPTVYLRVNPLWDFPTNRELLHTIEDRYKLEISQIILYNMSNEKKKRYDPFIINYTKPKDIVMDITAKYNMQLVKNNTLPDVYTLMYHGKKIGIACVRTLEQSRILRKWMKDNQRGVFGFNKIYKKWEPIV